MIDDYEVNSVCKECVLAATAACCCVMLHYDVAKVSPEVSAVAPLLLHLI